MESSVIVEVGATGGVLSHMDLGITKAKPAMRSSTESLVASTSWLLPGHDTYKPQVL